MKKLLALLLALILPLTVLPAALAEDAPADGETAVLPEVSSPEDLSPADFGLPESEAYMIVWVSDMFQVVELLPEYVGRQLKIHTTDAEGNDHYNLIEILENGFVMAEADCDDQVCVYEGEVTLENRADRILGAFILCLPHGVQLQLADRSELMELFYETFFAPVAG